MKIDYAKLCSILKKARKENDFSQMKLSHKLCITQKTYSVLENKDGNMSIVQFLKVMHVLHLNPIEVIDQMVSENPSWRDNKSVEEVLKNEIAELKTRNVELKSENVFLRNHIENLLHKPCCKE